MLNEWQAVWKSVVVPQLVEYLSPDVPLYEDVTSGKLDIRQTTPYDHMDIFVMFCPEMGEDEDEDLPDEPIFDRAVEWYRMLLDVQSVIATASFHPSLVQHMNILRWFGSSEYMLVEYYNAVEYHIRLDRFDDDVTDMFQDAWVPLSAFGPTRHGQARAFLNDVARALEGEDPPRHAAEVMRSLIDRHGLQ
ncbi:unnamed protein product [Symbiodinium natans]|uniref:Uncharacterized protein n=1 Tax=Symbiodinium natans TaxID=878477 RepID=A0A812LX59_9DINO|nr:unnamed protein product [Symbiodinium natans]